MKNYTLIIQKFLFASLVFLSAFINVSTAQTACMVIDGSNYNQTTGTLAIRADGTTACTEHDQITLINSATATIGGNLEFTFGPSYVPTIGDQYDIITGGTVTGTFSTLDLPTSPDYALKIMYNTSSVMIIVESPCTLFGLQSEYCANDMVDVINIDPNIADATYTWVYLDSNMDTVEIGFTANDPANGSTGIAPSNLTVGETYTVQVTCENSDGACFAEGTFTVNGIPAVADTTLTYCDEVNGTATFDLDALNISMDAGVQVSFHLNEGQANSGVSPLTNTDAYVSGTITRYARVTDMITGCYNVATINLVVADDPVAPALDLATPSSGVTVCSGDIVSAVTLAGTDGAGTCVDSLQYTIDGGTTWNGYASGDDITSEDTGADMVQVRSRRVCDGPFCDGDAETFAVIAMWSVSEVPEITVKFSESFDLSIDFPPASDTVSINGDNPLFIDTLCTSKRSWYQTTISGTAPGNEDKIVKIDATIPTGVFGISIQDGENYFAASQLLTGAWAFTNSTDEVKVVTLTMTPFFDQPSGGPVALDAGECAGTPVTLTYYVDPIPSATVTVSGDVNLNIPIMGNNGSGSTSTSNCSPSQLDIMASTNAVAASGPSWLKIKVDDPTDQLGFGTDTTIYRSVADFDVSETIVNELDTITYVELRFTPYFESGDVSDPALISQDDDECTGGSRTVRINYIPTPKVLLDITSPTIESVDSDSDYDQTVCSGTSFTFGSSTPTKADFYGTMKVEVTLDDPQNLLGMGTAAVFNEDADQVSFDQMLVNTTNSPVTVSGFVVPYLDTPDFDPTDNILTENSYQSYECIGDTVRFSITVEPTPALAINLTAPLSASSTSTMSVSGDLCNDAQLTATLSTMTTSSSPLYVQVDVTDAQNMLGLGMDTTIFMAFADFDMNTMLNNSSDTTATVLVSVTPYFAACDDVPSMGCAIVCAGAPASITFDVEPTPEFKFDVSSPVATVPVGDLDIVGCNETKVTFDIITENDKSENPLYVEITYDDPLNWLGYGISGVVIVPIDSVYLDTTLINNTTNPVTATFVYLPYFETGDTSDPSTIMRSAEECTGVQREFKVKIRPTPSLEFVMTAPDMVTVDADNPYTTTVCNETTFTGSASQLTFAGSDAMWVELNVSDPADQFGLPGGPLFVPVGDIDFDDMLTNSTDTSVTYSVSMLPYFESVGSDGSRDIAECTGDEVFLTVTVEPTPTVSALITMPEMVTVDTDNPYDNLICDNTPFRLGLESATKSSADSTFVQVDIVDATDALGLGGTATLYMHVSELSVDTMVRNITNVNADISLTITPYLENDPLGASPSLDADECVGTAITIELTVEPSAKISIPYMVDGDSFSGTNTGTVVYDREVCSGAAVSVGIPTSFDNTIESSAACGELRVWTVVFDSTGMTPTSTSFDVAVGTGFTPAVATYTNVKSTKATVRYSQAPYYDANGNELYDQGEILGDGFSVIIVIRPELKVVDLIDNVEACSASPYAITWNDYIENIGDPTDTDDDDLQDIAYAWTITNISPLPILLGAEIGDTGTGDVTNTVTNPFTIVQTITYEVQTTTVDGCVGETFEVMVDINAQPVASINPGGPNGLCEGENRLLSGFALPATSDYTYSWSLQGGSGDASLANATTLNPTLIAPTDGTTSVTVILMATNDDSGCVATTDYTFSVNPSPMIAAGFPINLSECEGTLNGNTSVFDLTDAMDGATSNGETVTYHVSASDAQDGLGIIPNPENYTGTDDQVIFVRVENGGCAVTDHFTVDAISLTYVVTNDFDSGTGSLRSVLAETCINDTIYFAPNLMGKTIDLTTGELDIPIKVEAIKGFGIDQISISANDNSRIFNIQTGDKVELIGLTLTNGAETIDGGAIINNGELILENVRLKSNSQNGIPKAVTNGPGAVMLVRGTVIIED